MQNKKFIGANTRRLALTGIYLRGLFPQEDVEKSSNEFYTREPGEDKTSQKQLHLQQFINAKLGNVYPAAEFSGRNLVHH